METSDYTYNGKMWRRSETVADKNSFFHSAFGVRADECNIYLDKQAKYRRMCWAAFLTYFESEAVPPRLAEVLKKCLSTNDKYKDVSIEDQSRFKGYVSDITNAEHAVTLEEIPLVAALENIKIILFSDKKPDLVTIINPDLKILGSYPNVKQFNGEVVLCLEGNVFSRMNPFDKDSSLKSDKDKIVNVKNANETTEKSSSDLIRYKKGGSAGSEGVQFQVGLLTIFFLNTIQKLRNWKLSTENNAAGKFDDVVFECPEGAILLQAKHKQSKTKRISLEELISTNSKNDDFSLPKYFLSYQEIKKTFKVKDVIICTNANVDGKTMKFLKSQKVSPESMLYYEKCDYEFYVFRDEILPHLKENIKSYYEKNFQNKGVSESEITDENIKDFLRHLQLYSSYPPGNDVGKVTEHVLSHMERLKDLPDQISPLEIYTKILNWFQQKDGIYLTELYAKAIFSEIWRDKHWQRLEKYNIFFQHNYLNFQNLRRIIHLTVENGCLLHEIKIIRTLQNNKTKVLFINPDDSTEKQKQVVEAFGLPKYTILVLVWSIVTEESVVKEISCKLKQILDKYEYKKVVLVADCNNKIPQYVGSCKDNYDVINEFVTLKDLSDDSQERLLKKEIIIFQGNAISLKELFADQSPEDYGTFLNSEILQMLIRNEKVKVGLPPSDLSEDIMQVYIKRKFRSSTEDGSGSTTKQAAIFPQDTLYEVNEKVVLISDGAGMGKSTVLTSLAVSIKKNHPHLWVIRINLSSYTKILKDFLGKNRETINILDLLNSKYSTKLTNQLEKSVFLMDRKVVLMFDGFDEIGPDYTQLILDLLRQCQNAPNYDKIFITSRPHVALELVTNLQVRSFTLEPFTKQNQVHFLASYWKHNLHLADTEKDKCERYAVALINRVFYWIEQHQSGENYFAAVPLQIRMLAEIFQESDRFEKALEWQRCKEFLVSNEAEPKLPENMNIMRLYQMFVDKKRNIFMDKGNPTGNTVANHALIDQFEECIAYQRTLALEVILDKTKCELFSCYRESRRNVEINMLNIGIVQKLDNEFHFIHRTFAEYFVAESLLKELQTQNDDLKFQTYLIEEILLAPQFNVTRVFLNGFLQPVVDDLPSRTFQRYQSISYKINLSNRKLGLLHELAGEGHVAIFQLILKCIDIVKDIPVISTHGIDTPTGNTPEHTVYGNILNIMLNRVQREGLDMTDGFKTLLEYAAENGHLEMVKFLVQRGANVNIGVCKPLHLAVQAGHIEVSKFLIEQGADIKSLDFLDDSSVLYKAVRKNDVATATYLLNEMWKTDDLNINVSNNIAHTAACLGNIGILKNLVERGVDVNNRVEYGETPFFGAVRGGQLETIKYLVQRGCDINSEDHRNRTALHIIAPNPSDVSTAKFLIDLGIDVNVISSDMKTALHLALEGPNYDLMESLVNSGADVDLEDEKGATALHLAASKYQQLAVKLLVEHGANLNKRDKWGRTPLHVVILNDFSIFDSYGYPNCIPNIVFSKDRLEITKFIIENGADLNTTDIKGRTALHLGAISGQSDIVMLLMQFEVDANIRDNDGRAAVHLATLGGHTDIVKFLVLHNVDITIKDNSGHTILPYSSFCRDQLDILKLIKAHTGDVNVEGGCSALHSAVERGDLDTVIFLVETGIDVNIRDKEGNSALHLAINKGHFSIVEYLVKIGVDITVQDNYGYTALHLAVKSSDSDMSFRRDNNDPALQSPAHVNDSDGAKIRKNTEVHICDRINTESLFERSGTDISMSLNVLDNQLSAVLRYVKDNQPDLNSISEKLEALNSSTLEALKSIGDTTKKIKSVLIPSSDERGTHIKDNNITTLPLALQEASLNFEKVFTAIRANKVHDSGNVPFFAKFCTGTNSKSNDTMSLPSVIDNGSSSTFKFPGNTGKSFSVRDNKCMVLPFTPKPNDTKPDALENRTITETKERICYLDIIAMLVLQCNEVLDMRDKNGHTPLHLAILKGNLEVVNFLVKHKADVNVTDNSGRTSLQLAAKNGNLDIVKLLIDHGVDVNNQGNDGWTALLTAVWEGQLNIVKFLITECNADMNTIDKDGRTAVHLAASEGHLETLVFLLQCGMDAEVRDNDGRTAIHLAALGSPSYLPRFFGLSGEAKHKVYLSVVNLLMKQGVDVNSKDTNGNTAAFLAEREGHLEMAKYLEAFVCSGTSRN